MRHRSFLTTLLTLMMVAALATAALAAKPEIPPGKPTVTITTVPEYWTCEARVANGAVWPLFTYSEGTSTYVTNDGPLLCVDINIPEPYWDRTEWTVDWSGSTAKGTVKGLKLVFEEEVHGTVYAEEVFHAESGDWTVFLLNADVKNLVFVAMPHSGDKWIGPVTFTITSSEG